jgi:signal transduction histidine kinase
MTPQQHADRLRGVPAFIRNDLEVLLRGWDRFAAALAQNRAVDHSTLRDHAREILLAVAEDMATEQSNQEQIDKSRGLRPESLTDLNVAAVSHGLGRLAAQFSLDDLAVELRALRASVLRHIASSGIEVSIAELTRFNEAIDQVLAGSIAAYSEKLAHTQALERESELRRQLLLRMDAAQEEDRRRIARELHDSLGQKLVAMSLCLSRLRRQPMEEPARRHLDELASLLATSDQELDQLVFELRPIALQGRGLMEALQAHVSGWSAMAGVKVDVAADGLEECELPQHVEVAIFRVIQEALNNVAKHARAQHVGITVQRRHEFISTSVEDDGVGFDVSQDEGAGRTPRGWGLAGMKERIEALGGHFGLESGEGTGTTVLVRLPLMGPSRPAGQVAE